MAVNTDSEVFANPIRIFLKPWIFGSSKSPITMASQANNYIQSFEIDNRSRYMVKLKSVGEAVISPAVTLMSEAENNCFIMPKSCCVVYCTSNIKTNPELKFKVLPLRTKDSKRRALWLQARSPFK